MNEAPQVPAGVDTGRPTPARIYDYMLQGNSYFQVDRFAAEQILKAAPEIRDAAWSNRGFHQRAAKWIAQNGVRQFVDIGSGLPTVGNTHEVVQKVVPAAHVVYVDNDPMVELHSRALLDSGGMISVICADLREPDAILDHPDYPHHPRLYTAGRIVGQLRTAKEPYMPTDHPNLRSTKSA
jgi:S-adenosyl methyltransferase